MNKFEIAERLKSARIKAGFETASQAANSMGVVPATYLAHENASRGIRNDALERYARKFKVDMSYLLTGMDSSPILKKKADGVSVDGDVQAGVFQEAHAIEPYNRKRVPFSTHPDYSDYEQSAVRVRGASMNEMWPEGTYLLVVWIEFCFDDIMPEHEDFVVVKRYNSDGQVEMTVKQYMINRERGELWPRSNDPRFQNPIKLTDSTPVDSVQICGLIKGAANFY